MTPAQERISKAKSLLLMSQVFYATIIMGSKLIEDDVMPGSHGLKPLDTACTDMVDIWYNPKFILSLSSIELVMFVLAHEVMHIALCHGFRRGSRTPDRWNIACDFAINWILKESGFVVWAHAYCDEKYAGMSAEQIYDLRERDSVVRPIRGRPVDEGVIMGRDLVDIEHSMSPADKAKAEQHVRRMVADAITQARLQGQLPGRLARAMEGLLNPPLPWERLFRDFSSRMAKHDENWSRRNRRFAGTYLPARWSTAMGEIVIIGDTSGSMPDGVFPQIAEEIRYMVETVKPERVRVIWADDTECESMEVFEAGDEIVLNPKGMGGTDMRKPMSYVERFDPICVVLITDCETPWPAIRPPYPLITVSTDSRKKCPHGETVYFSGPL